MYGRGGDVECHERSNVENDVVTRQAYRFPHSPEFVESLWAFLSQRADVVYIRTEETWPSTTASSVEEFRST